MKSRLVKKFIAYGLLPFMVVFFAFTQLGVNTAFANGYGLGDMVADMVGAASEPIAQAVTSFLVGVNQVFTALLYFVGRLLDFAIQFSIAPGIDLNTGEGGLYRSDAVNLAWTLLRDIINMSFIFILLYVAIGTVLNINGVDWKKQVARIIVAAILVNFSLFVTRVVIDAGNIVANGFYQEITTCAEGECGGREHVGISERFVNALGLPYFGQIRGGNVFTDNDTEWTEAAAAFVQLIVILVAIWVFFSVAILFFTRSIALIFILILSPIGIAGESIPLLGKFAVRWRGELFKQSLLGIVFLFFTFVILLFASERDSIFQNSRIMFEDVTMEELPITGPPGAVHRPESYFVMYVLIAAALVMTLRITKSLSGQGAGWMEDVRKKTLGVAGLGIGVTAAGAALLGRQTLGRGTRAALDSKLIGGKLKDSAEKGNRFALVGQNMLKGGAAGSYDIRTAPGGALITKQAAKLGGVAGLGASVGIKAGQGGRAEKIKKDVEATKKQMEDFSPEALRTWANKFEAEASWGPKAGLNKKRASELRKMADRKETNKEEREKIVDGFTKGLRAKGGDANEVRKIMGKLRPADYRGMPPEVLTLDNVIDNYNVGELRSISTVLLREDKETIFDRLINTHPTSSATVRNYLIDPENGWIK